MPPFPQERRHVSEPELFEPSQNGLRRHATVKATRSVLESRKAMLEAVEALRRVASMHAESKAAVVPRRQVPRLPEPKDQAAMAMPVAEQVALEARNMAEPEPEIADAELEYEPSVAEVTEVPRLELPMLPKETASVELEAMVRPVKFCAGVPREMPKTEAAVAGLGRLRCNSHRRQHGCEHQNLAHRPAPRSSVRRSHGVPISNCCANRSCAYVRLIHVALVGTSAMRWSNLIAPEWLRSDRAQRAARRRCFGQSSRHTPGWHTLVGVSTGRQVCRWPAHQHCRGGCHRRLVGLLLVLAARLQRPT